MLGKLNKSFGKYCHSMRAQRYVSSYAACTQTWDSHFRTITVDRNSCNKHSVSPYVPVVSLLSPLFLLHRLIPMCVQLTSGRSVLMTLGGKGTPRVNPRLVQTILSVSQYFVCCYGSVENLIFSLYSIKMFQEIQLFPFNRPCAQSLTEEINRMQRES